MKLWLLWVADTKVALTTCALSSAMHVCSALHCQCCQIHPCSRLARCINSGIPHVLLLPQPAALLLHRWSRCKGVPHYINVATFTANAP
jgi:hypothetical protein